ncbi:GFA family protein [Pseudomonas solani]|uniref:GFA family protein n=1 Tax=Pseudomonas solani TaxID=2731552 RepID=UPI000397379D|nr:hypothetical protein L682_21260 [Pseudomonas alcaligenes OT 69]MDN4147062.1 GFA family protein [Pseudomonas tohonis]
MTTDIHQGGCLCGQVRFEVQGPLENPHTCSCQFCQRHSGALTVAWVEVPRERLRWTGPAGAPATYRSSDYSSRAFCAHCGSSLGAIDDEPTIALLVGSLDHKDSPALMPTYESFEDGRPAWWHAGTRHD